MLCMGFLFLVTTAHSYYLLRQELDSPYVLPGTVIGQADLEKYMEVPSLEAATPVLSFESQITTKDATLGEPLSSISNQWHRGWASRRQDFMI